MRENLKLEPGFRQLAHHKDKSKVDGIDKSLLSFIMRSLRFQCMTSKHTTVQPRSIESFFFDLFTHNYLQEKEKYLRQHTLVLNRQIKTQQVKIVNHELNQKLKRLIMFS